MKDENKRMLNFFFQTEDVTKHVANILPKLSVEDHKAGVKRVSDDDYPANISGKIPKWIDVDSVAERYKITDSLDSTSEEQFKDKWMTLIDVEDCWSISRLTNLATEEVSHVTIRILLHKSKFAHCSIYAASFILLKMKQKYNKDK